MADGPHHGACLCGEVTFELQGAPRGVFQCYCSHCQKNAGGPSQVTAMFPTSALSVHDPKGHAKRFDVTDGTTSGKPKAKYFCANCGCTLWTAPEKFNDEIRMVRTTLIEDGLRKFKIEQEIFKPDFL